MISGSNHPEGNFDFLKKITGPLHTGIRNYSSARPASWGAFVILMAIFIGFFSKFPAYRDAEAPFPGSLAQFSKTQYGQAIDWWMKHPFQRVPTETIFDAGSERNPWLNGAISHCDKLTFRAFLPTIGRLTNGGFYTLIVANHLAALAIFILVYALCRRHTDNALIATFSTWAYAVCWAGSLGFSDVINGDAVAMALMLAALWTNRFLFVASCIFFAGFTDERAIFATPLIMLFRYWQSQPPFAETNRGLDLKYLKMASLPVIAGLLAYGAVRLYMSQRFGLTTGTSMIASPQIPVHHFYINYPGTLFKVFEFLWLAPVLMILNLGFSDKVHRINPLAYVICMFLVSTPTLVVWDFDRNMFYLLPAVLASICFAAGAVEERMQLAFGLFVISFIWLNPLESWLRFLI